jgi:16S rRNA (guanine966-N2)-methyltransferase
VRIVAGRHKGRRLQAPAGRDIRPTTDRLRETVFNILMHSDWGPGGGDPVSGAVVLDAFCGTGALGLEALSRGASEAWFLDRSPQALATARANAALLGEEARAGFLRGDALRQPPARARAGLILLDPPYGQGLGPAALAALAAAGWPADGGAVAVLETAAHEGLPDDLRAGLLTGRTIGDTAVWVLRILPSGS